MEREKIDHLQEFPILQLEKGLGVTMWCLFLSTKMENMPIVRRWGIKIVNYLRGFFSFSKKKTKDGEEK